MSDSRDGKEFVGKFYVNAYGHIGLILDYNAVNGGECSWISTGGSGFNHPVSVENVKETTKNFNEIKD